MIDEKSFLALALGDIVTLDDGRTMSVRSKVEIAIPVGAMAGFVLLGELEMLLSIPALSGAPLAIYLPIERFPVPADHSRSAAEGAARYWAPHLPALGQAMGEIYYRVIEIRGTADPAVIIYRGPEAVVFVRTGYTFTDALDVLALPRDAANEHVPVERHVAEVDVVPSYVPAPEEIYSTFTTR